MIEYETEVTQAVNAYVNGLQQVWRTINKVRRDQNILLSERVRLLSRLYSPLSTKDIKQSFVTDGEAFDIGVSFRSSITNTMRLKSKLAQLGYSIAPSLNSKESDQEFAKRLGVPIPLVHSRDTSIVDLKLRPHTIIKPALGDSSRGVFFVDKDLQLMSLRTHTTYDNLANALHELRGHETRVSIDKWITEEALTGPDGELANDLKFYSFYGRIGAVLEIARGRGADGQNLYCSYRPDGETFKFLKNISTFEGAGVPSGWHEYARRLSLASPVPFLRIDFLRGSGDCYLGEITPHPGGIYAGRVFDNIDKEFGHLFLEAEARLLIDLFNGKTFPEYFSTYNVTKSSHST